MRRLVLCVITAILVGPAAAATKAGVKMADSVQVGDKRLVLNGMGLREATVLKVDVYVAGLYVERPSADPSAILAPSQTKGLVLYFVRDVDRDGILRAWTDGFKKNSTVPLSAIQPQIDQLSSWTGDLKDGDKVTFTYRPGIGVEVAVNATRKGVIEGDEFARSLFAIWIGPNPPSGAIKKGLLGSR